MRGDAEPFVPGSKPAQAGNSQSTNLCSKTTSTSSTPILPQQQQRYVRPQAIQDVADLEIGQVVKVQPKSKLRGMQYSRGPRTPAVNGEHANEPYVVQGIEENLATGMLGMVYLSRIESCIIAPDRFDEAMKGIINGGMVPIAGMWVEEDLPGWKETPTCVVLVLDPEKWFAIAPYALETPNDYSLTDWLAPKWAMQRVTGPRFQAIERRRRLRARGPYM